MRLTVHTDYALRLLMFLGAHREELVTIQEVSDAYGISKNHLMKVAHQLGLLGYIETVRGRGGGLRLAVDPEDIPLDELVRETEEDFALVECLDSTRNQCAISKACLLQGIVSEATEAFLETFSKYTLADLLVNTPRLRQLVPY